jgi:hypothetical protein
MDPASVSPTVLHDSANPISSPFHYNLGDHGPESGTQPDALPFHTSESRGGPVGTRTYGRDSNPGFAEAVETRDGQSHQSVSGGKGHAASGGFSPDTRQRVDDRSTNRSRPGDLNPTLHHETAIERSDESLSPVRRGEKFHIYID